MLYKPLLIVQVTIKPLLKCYTVVQKQSNSITKVGEAHTYIPNFYKGVRLQLSVQINEVLLYNKKETN